MNVTYKLVELTKAKKGIESDYGIAKLIGVTSQKVSHWKMQRSEANALTILKLVKESGLSIDDAINLMTEKPYQQGGALSKTARMMYIM